MANDLSLAVHVEMSHGYYLGSQWNVGRRQTDSVKCQLQIALANEVAGLLGAFQASEQIGAAREDRLARLLHVARITKKRIPHADGGGGQLAPAQRTRHERSRGHADVARLACA